MTPASAAEARRDLARHRVSAEFALPLALIDGETEEAMRLHATAALAASREARRR